MKEFFKKIWEAIKNAWNKFTTWLLNIKQDRYIFALIAMALAAFFAIVTPKVAEWPIAPVIMLFIFYATIRLARGKFLVWKNYLAAFLGALVIQIFMWIA